MERYKYPRTFHHPTLSQSVAGDDKKMSLTDLSNCYGLQYVCTEKMDGECTTIYEDCYSHARSIDSGYHPSRSMVKSLASTIGYQLPRGYRVCGENLYAKHSIKYEDLPSEFLVFNMFKYDTCVSWGQVERMAGYLGLETVPVLWRGVLSEEVIKSLYDSLDTEVSEGLVFRPVYSFSVEDFHKKVFKIVRDNHVKTDSHWMHNEMELNGVTRNLDT